MQQNSGSNPQPPAQPSQEHNQRQQTPPSHPQWVAMQYSTASMVMQHQMMQPQHFVSPPPPPQHYLSYHPHHNQFSTTRETRSSSKDTALAERTKPFGLVICTIGWTRTTFTAVSLLPARPMRIGVATPRKSSGYQQQYSSQGGHASNGASTQSDGDSSNTTIFFGGLDPNVTEEDLRQPFSQYGEIVSVKIHVGKGCGFVQFASRNNAEEALQKLNGTIRGKQTVRVSWGGNPANKQWGGAYYGGAVYDGYGYVLPSPHNPAIYAAAYGAYPFYGSYQQQVN
ncbi:Polyadenylate-binding protein RBP47 [Hibiscus syriacus]|uniref:Polyadenylate-binding protein RBP47 n=1 Tax=Hibiscus syriacus TaxID=106335 RepID=A0A6A3CK59_HIBSY|nr:Polyadenylate-binding protein RBP47 [Hibiscus syriacus]